MFQLGGPKRSRYSPSLAAVKWAAVGKRVPGAALHASFHAAVSQSDSASETLCRHGSDINATAYETPYETVLVLLIQRSETEGARRIASHGGIVPAKIVHTLFRQTAFKGRVDLAAILSWNKEGISTVRMNGMLRPFRKCMP